MPVDLDALQAACDAATDGCVCGYIFNGTHSLDLPALLTEVEALRAKCAAYEKRLLDMADDVGIYSVSPLSNDRDKAWERLCDEAQSIRNTMQRPLLDTAGAAEKPPDCPVCGGSGDDPTVSKPPGPPDPPAAGKDGTE